MRFLVLLPVLCSVLYAARGGPRRDTGSFWHISDLHLDFYYSPEGGTGLEICPSSYGTEPLEPGKYGDYRCDSPMRLINSSINAMKSIDGTPDFILWTGDDTLHTSEQYRYLSEQLVLDSIWNITELLQQTFPSTIVFASLGNHDYHPKHQMPPHMNAIVQDVAGMWEPWMTIEQFSTFQEMGFGARLVPTRDLRIIMLNTNLWDKSNENIDGESDLDPAGQFKWFENQLNITRLEGRKVYITGHIGPGFFEMCSNETYLYKRYNDRYMELVRNYSDVIEGQFFGHHHTDSFRLFYNDTKHPISALFYTPGVTPRIGIRDGSTNPGIRLHQYDRTTFKQLDFTQYFLNLSQANVHDTASWVKEYSALSEYNIRDLSPTSLHAVVSRLRSDVPCSDEKCDSQTFLQRYHLLNTVSYAHNVCDDTCQRNHVCAIENVDDVSHDQCISDWKGNSAAQNSAGVILIPLTLLFHIN